MTWEDYEKTLLALTVYREARGEGYTGMTAVAHSIMNRVKHPKWWGNSISAVLAKKWQYSSLTDPKDRQLIIFPVRGDSAFAQAMQAVDYVLSGMAPNLVPNADSYYDQSIAPPAWATSDKKVGQIGRLTFFNIDGDTGD